MSDFPPNDDSQNTPARGELLAASTIVRFYTFADRCMDWAKTTRSIHERILYGQMALKYLAAAARLHTILQLRSKQAAQQMPIEQTECLTSAT
jgi:hypothetical protein